MQADPLSIALLVGVAVFLLWRGRLLITTLIPATRLEGFLVTGDYSSALALAARFAERPVSTYAANALCCVLISAGQYRRALALGERHKTVGFTWPLLQVNLAEAEYNLGEWARALARLDVAVRKIGAVDIMAKTGEACQRAWVLAHLGRHEEAATSYARATVDHLPGEYASEYHFTRAYLALSKGLGTEALAAVDDGLKVAARPSTRRNGLYLRARALELAGQADAALAEFQRGADHDYKYQGGDGLLAWGELLARVGRHEDATNAWRLAVERDPESESAALAAKRLEHPAGELSTIAPV